MAKGLKTNNMSNTPFKMKGSPFQRNFGIGSPLKHDGDGKHPQHHDDDYFEGTTRKVIDTGEEVGRKVARNSAKIVKNTIDYAKTNIEKGKKDPIGAIVGTTKDIATEYVKPYKSAWNWLKKKFD